MPESKYKYNHAQQSFSDKNGDIDCIIGDAKNSDFKEEVKLSWNKEWSNMFDLSVRLNEANIFDKQASTKQVSELNGKIISSSDIIKNEYSDIVENGEVVGKKHNTILFAKPKSNVLEYTCKWKGLDLFEQKPLTSEYKAGWNDRYNCEIDVTETQVIDVATGRVLTERPEKYVNSLAIYNNQKAGRIIRPGEGDWNYYNGKLGHLERKCAILPDGSRVWLKQSFDAKKGIMTVTLPDVLLNDESLFTKGLIIDPTFGYTADPATAASSTTRAFANIGNRIYTASTGDALTNMSVYGKSSSGTTTLSGAVYTTSAGVPSARILTPIAINMTSNTPQWWTGNYSVNLTNGTSYCAAHGNLSSSNGSYYSDTSTENCSRNNSNLSDPWVDSISFAQSYGVYATYTAGGGGSTFLPKTYIYN